jgi:cell wall-associated NlpC family hydrolase
MRKAFDGGFARTEGMVTAAEVDSALVRALGYRSEARALSRTSSPDGWSPPVRGRFGTEVLARELGLRHDRPTSEERFEAAAGDPMTQADAIYAVWKAKVSPSTWAVDELRGFTLPNYSDLEKKVVGYALSQVGLPYVWAGEWGAPTGSGYPYGAQAAGGFDCSGFAWYVLRSGSSSWKPQGRPYSGWRFDERASRDMAKGARKRLRLRDLRPGDVLFFGSEGRDSEASDVYHAGVYVGRGWMVDSSGSQNGVSLSRVSKGSWWNGQFAWGRRIIRN